MECGDLRGGDSERLRLPVPAVKAASEHEGRCEDPGERHEERGARPQESGLAVRDRVDEAPAVELWMRDGELVGERMSHTEDQPSTPFGSAPLSAGTALTRSN